MCTLPADPYCRLPAMSLSFKEVLTGHYCLQLETLELHYSSDSTSKTWNLNLIFSPKLSLKQQGSSEFKRMTSMICEVNMIDYYCLSLHITLMSSEKQGSSRLNGYGDRYLEDQGEYNYDLDLLFLTIIEILWENVAWLHFKEFGCKNSYHIVSQV